MKPKQMISALVLNRPGVLQRVCGLFGRRDYNIESITVGVAEDETVSRMVLVLCEDEVRVEQIGRQLSKLIDVIRVTHLNLMPLIAKELMLIKVRAEPAVRPEIFGMAETFRCPVIDIGQHSVVIQVVGDREKNDSFLSLLRPYGILEVTRTGETAMNREEA